MKSETRTRGKLYESRVCKYIVPDKRCGDYSEFILHGVNLKNRNHINRGSEASICEHPHGIQRYVYIPDSSEIFRTFFEDYQ